MRLRFYFPVMEGGHLEEQSSMALFHHFHDQYVFLGSLNRFWGNIVLRGTIP